MHKVLKIWLIAFSLLQQQPLFAQEKYAVLVGVDEYTDAPGHVSPSSLKGCVNDAKSIRELLINRFGFKNDNIRSLYNSLATKKNLLEVMRSTLQQCKEGDAVVFFFSGHGVWMKNLSNIGDKIKDGMSQAIVMSDLYSNEWECLVRDETLKQIVNKFVDKKVIVTSIFDCCFSENLMMLMRYDLYWDGHTSHAEDKDMDIRYIPYYSDTIPPPPCKNDSTDNIDSDHDGVIDCLDWEPHTPQGSYVDGRGITTELDPGGFAQMDDAVFNAFDFNATDTAQTKSFSLKTTLTVNEKMTQARPTLRPGSAALSLSASTDHDKGLEITDVNGLRHGAFTAALLHAYENNKADMSVETLMAKIKEIMSKEMYTQGPSHYAEGVREKGNLVGVKINEETPLRVNCVLKKGNTVTINKGSLSNVNPGNIFRDISIPSHPTIRIDQTTKDSASGKDASEKILPGHILELSNSYISSAPLVKVLVPAVNFTTTAYQAFIKKTIVPLALDSNYRDHSTIDIEGFLNKVLFYRNERKVFSVSPYPIAHSTNFTVFLPPPSFFSIGLRKWLQQDQNIELVTDTAKANIVLFIEYSPKANGGKPGYIISFNTPKIIAEDYIGTILQPVFIVEPSLSLDAKGMTELYKRIDALILRLVRRNTTGWINIWPRQ